jgi:hypothetical protein
MKKHAVNRYYVLLFRRFRFQFHLKQLFRHCRDYLSSFKFPRYLRRFTFQIASNQITIT